MAVGLLTLLFQIYVRAGVCEGPGACALSFVKAAVWACIWPLSWIVFIAGFL